MASSPGPLSPNLPGGPGPAPGLMPALTGIRFPLAMWVVAHHAAAPGQMLAPIVSASATVAALVDAAWLALTVFFAISGFVLARRYRYTIWTRQALTRYAITRFGRIYPVYFLSLVILLPIIWHELATRDLGGVTERAGLVFNYLFLLQAWVRPSVNWNTPAWSLSAEVFFYASAPLLILLVRKTTAARVLVTAVIACLVPIVLRLSIDPPIPKALLYFGDFMVGIAAAGAYDWLRTSSVDVDRLGRWLAGPALAAGAVLVLTRDHLGSFLVFDTGIRLVSAALVLGLACGGGAVVRALSSGAMVAGGQASYAIYILHVPLLWWYPRWWIHAALPPVASGLVFVALVLLMSLVVARYYEAPANRLIRNWLARRPEHGRSPDSLESQRPLTVR